MTHQNELERLLKSLTMPFLANFKINVIDLLDVSERFLDFPNPNPPAPIPPVPTSPTANPEDVSVETVAWRSYTHTSCSLGSTVVILGAPNASNICVCVVSPTFMTILTMPCVSESSLRLSSVATHGTASIDRSEIVNDLKSNFIFIVYGDNCLDSRASSPITSCDQIEPSPWHTEITRPCRETIRHFPAGVARSEQTKLVPLSKAKSLDGQREPPVYWLKPLKDGEAGTCSIRINDQWRVTFRWTDGAAEDVRVEDYH